MQQRYNYAFFDEASKRGGVVPMPSPEGTGTA